MAARKKARKVGLLIEVHRALSVGRDRSTGRVHLRFEDDQGRLVAVRMRPRQLRTLANGVLGLAEALVAEGYRPRRILPLPSSSQSIEIPSFSATVMRKSMLGIVLPAS